MARLKSSTESLPSCRTRVSNFKASCELAWFLVTFCNRCGWISSNFQETMHVDMCTKPKDPKVLFNGHKNSLGFESRSLGHVMLYCKICLCIGMHMPCSCPRSWSTSWASTTSTSWVGAITLLAIGGVAPKAIRKTPNTCRSTLPSTSQVLAPVWIPNLRNQTARVKG